MVAGSDVSGVLVILGPVALGDALLCWLARLYGVEPQIGPSTEDGPSILLMGDYDACHVASSAYWWSIPYEDEEYSSH